jgi:hypothetical protein
VQGVGYFESEVEIDTAALELETDVAALELKTDMAALELEMKTDASLETSKQERYSADYSGRR